MTQEPTTEPRTYPEGVTSWIDIEPKDIEAAKSFYGGLFGWSFSDATPPETPFRYVIAQIDGKDVAGIGGPREPSPSEPPQTDLTWNTYVAVDDAQQAADRVRAAGGRIVQPPTPAGEGGVSVVCADSSGVEFGMFQANKRLGAQITNTPGTWNFSDLHTADAAKSTEFYTQVFGWAVDDLGFATMIRRPGYGDHLAATVDPGIHERQSGEFVPPGFADAIGWMAPVASGESPHWHVAFTVADRDETAAAAERLGGTVVARNDTEWTKDAVIRDPHGALFTASQFTPPT
ncbi:VOC family protein [Antrihabitans sp. YC2-6]|uniref:VOC family protein n=1 Tax=Antrihabitans sp. YC2-6 TaxID=2799498 RepID=UPI0018F303E2|nr:VOC family protein [Antrihabitans sp. YC2-6]MBJ8345456.1 VOC family protein [Antrihabitans sp. YC2-6]